MMPGDEIRKGLRHTLPTTASIVAMVEPITAALFGLLVLGEALNMPQVAGMALILGAVTGLSILQNRPSRRGAPDRLNRSGNELPS
jgi:drug/metabolite transporter (DMT)-like permease